MEYYLSRRPTSPLFYDIHVLLPKQRDAETQKQNTFTARVIKTRGRSSLSASVSLRKCPEIPSIRQVGKKGGWKTLDFLRRKKKRHKSKSAFYTNWSRTTKHPNSL